VINYRVSGDIKIYKNLHIITAIKTFVRNIRFNGGQSHGYDINCERSKCY